MKVEEFKEMHIDDKINYLWDKGLAIHQDRIDNERTFCIFEISDFYVEAIFSKNKVNSIRLMVEVIQFEAYVDQLLRCTLDQS